MVICVCRRLNETAVREAVRAGVGTPKAVRARHGCKLNCGECKPAMYDVVECEKCQLTAGGELIAAE